jgi:hypothetical protein
MQFSTVVDVEFFASHYVTHYDILETTISSLSE